jgi:hypothetical protein
MNFSPVSLIVKHLSYTQEAGRRWRNTGANPVRGIFRAHSLMVKAAVS